jgi:hypothetical protein
MTTQINEMPSTFLYKNYTSSTPQIMQVKKKNNPELLEPKYKTSGL